jgi:putative tryptophan/tyrosine transport system substrate-binding protein
MLDVRRRKFITALGGALVAWSRQTRAQQLAMPVIGLLNGRSIDDAAYLVAAFRRGLNEAGYVEGHNVAIEYRWADGHYDRMPAMAADLVRRQVALIAALGDPSPFVAKAATATIPIVFLSGSDPVGRGMVVSLNRPGGNMTGVSVVTGVLVAKRMQLLREVVPTAAVFAMLVNPDNLNTETYTKDVKEAAQTLGLPLRILNASSDRDFDAVFATLVELRPSALVVGSDPFLNSRSEQLVALAARHAVPAIYNYRESVTAGGLMSYGTSLADGWRLAGVYAGKILRGAKPADLPVQNAVKVELVINLNTVKTLGLTFPLPLLGRADEVIE